MRLFAGRSSAPTRKKSPQPSQAEIARSHAHEVSTTGHSAKRTELTDPGSRARELSEWPLSERRTASLVADIGRRDVKPAREDLSSSGWAVSDPSGLTQMAKVEPL